MVDMKRSELAYGEAIDRCLYKSLIKFVCGVGVGIVLSAAVFKRKMWPVILGGGIGTGIGVNDCRHEFKETSPLSRIIVSPNSSPQEVSSADKSIS